MPSTAAFGGSFRPAVLSEKGNGIEAANPANLVAGLSSPSQLIRLHTQRLLVEQGGQWVVPELEELATGSDPLAAIHALWTLEGLGAAHTALASSLKSPRPLVRRYAMLALGVNDIAVVAALPALLDGAEVPRERLYVLTTAAQAPRDAAISQALWKFVSGTTPTDGTWREAARLAMRRQGIMLLGVDFANFSKEPPSTWHEGELLGAVSRIATGLHREALVKFATTAPAGLRGHVERILAAPPEIERKPVATPNRLVAGRDFYMKACIECHQADGRGVPLAFPPLAGSEWVKGERDTLLRIILGGLFGPVEVNTVKFNGVMPGHSHVSDEEIALIARFVRFAFGDLKEKPVTPEEVKALRPEVEKRKFVSWTVEDLRGLG